jgi:acetyl esterase/lipase
MIEHRIGTTRRSDAVHVVSKVALGPVMKWGPLLPTTMKLFPLIERAADRLPRSGRTSHRKIVARDWCGELVTPIDGTTSDGAILYLHGGAFLACGTATHRRIVERLAWRTGMAVLTVAYRQLPLGTLEHSLDDAEDAFRWLTRNGHPAHHIVLAGDSAGGHLAFATAVRMRDAGLRPAGVVGLSPWLDFDHRPKTRHHNARRDAYIPVRRLRRVGRMAVGSRVEQHHSPVNADLTDLPPALILVGADEVLRVDAELMAERLLDAGVQCTLQVWEGQVHAFPVLADLNPESLAAIEEIASFTRTSVAEAARGRRTGVTRIGVA